MLYLRQSTASQEVVLGPFVDATDGFTAETALTIANTDIKLYKFGSTAGANKNSGGATHDASGRYVAVFDATDTDTIGSGQVFVHVAGARPVWREFCVLDEAVFDALFGTVALATATNITAASGVLLSNAAQTIVSLTVTDGVTIARSTADSPGLTISGSAGGGSNSRAIYMTGNYGLVIESTSQSILCTSSASTCVDFQDTGGPGLNIQTASLDVAALTAQNFSFLTPSIQCVNGLSGPGFGGDIVGNITGNLSGSVGSVSSLRIKKNTALNNFEFLMVSSADHITPSTGLTVAATRSIDGGAFAACSNSVTEVSSGIYKINLSAADMNGNVVTLKFTATSADTRYVSIVTQDTTA